MMQTIDRYWNANYNKSIIKYCLKGSNLYSKVVSARCVGPGFVGSILLLVRPCLLLKGKVFLIFM
jgi:hypothetical protein